MDDVVKQGLLRRVPNPEGGGRPLSGLLGKLESAKWCVLAIRSGKPFFEVYEKEEEMFTGLSPRAVDLTDCKQVTYTLSRATKTFTFCIVLPYKVVQLIASTRQQLLGWVSAIERCLHTLGILEARDDSHVYSFCPAVVNIRGHATPIDEEDEEGAVGGADQECEYALSSDIPVLDEEGRDIFGTFGDAYLHRKASAEDPYVVKRRAQFSFDWMQEPTSMPVNEMKATTPTNESTEENSGSCDFVDTKFWERYKVGNGGQNDLPQLPVRKQGVTMETLLAKDDVGDNNNNRNSDSDFDTDGDYCGISQLAQVWVPSGSGGTSGTGTTCAQANINETVASTSNRQAATANDLNKKSNILTVNLPELQNSSSAASCATSCDNSKDKLIENDYAPFPTRKPVPDLINFNIYGTSSAPSQVSPQSTVFEVPLQPLPLRCKFVSTDNGISVVSVNHSDAQSSQLINQNLNSNIRSSNQNTAVVDGQNIVSASVKQLSSQSLSTSSSGELASSSSVTNNSLPISQTTRLRPPVPNLPLLQSRTTSNAIPSVDPISANNFSSASQIVRPRPPIPDIPSLKPRTTGNIASENGNHEKTGETNLIQLAQEETLYEGIFEGAEAAPVVPPRSDSLVLCNVAPKSVNASNITSPSLDPDFNFDRLKPVTPPLPPRNLIKSRDDTPVEMAPPIPAKFKDIRLQRSMTSPPTSSINGFVPENEFNHRPDRQLSTRMRLDRAQSVHTVISLKQNQIEILKEEMSLPRITVQVTKRWFHGLALVDSFNSVWVAGWNVNEFPRLHDKFHIGDRVVLLNNVPVQTSSASMKQIKHSDSDVVDIDIQRLPKANLFVIRRSAEGESLGIKREGGTGEIVYVDPYGLAGSHRLPLNVHNMYNDNLCHWYITEINSRPLNLFFKDMEIEHRLGAVGRDISLVVQPSDLIFDLKKQLKKLRNYKSFIIK